MRNLKAHLLYVFSNDFRIALGIAIVIRLAVFLITAAVPITADSRSLVSPTIAYGTDLTFYQDRKNVLISKSMGDLVKEYFSFPTKIRGMVAGPLFPILLHFFGYRSGNSLPMAILFLVGSFVLVALWLRWLYWQQIPLWGLTVFAVLPHPLFFMICVGTELPFSLLFSGFFIFYFKDEWKRADIMIWGSFLFLLLLTRPNALAVLLFVIVDLFVSSRGRVLTNLPYLIGSVFSISIFGIFFLPYFLLVNENSLALTFFGVPAHGYLEGLFHSLPGWLDRFLSLTVLLIAKIFYLMGLRPSYSNVPLTYVFMRALPGLILLPGTIYLFLRGESRHKLLVFFFIVPILMVAAQDRYNLPIQPLLFYYGYRAFESISSLCQRGSVLWVESA